MEKLELMHTDGRNVKWYRHFQNVCQSLKKPDIYLMIQHSTLRRLPNEIKAHVNTKPATQMFMAGLLVMAKCWTQHPWAKE